MIAALTLIFSIMTSYARARAESLVEKCKVGFMERPERIVLFMIGAFTNRMAAVLWVILVLSILAVANRIYYTYLALNNLPMPSQRRASTGCFNRAFFWTDERTTIPYDLWVIAILAFVWLTPPDWLGDPMAQRPGPARLDRHRQFVNSALRGCASLALRPRPASRPRRPWPASSSRADRVEALLQRVHQVDDLRRRLRRRARRSPRRRSSRR